jgi:hypothetical protein
MDVAGIQNRSSFDRGNRSENFVPERLETPRYDR